MKQTLKSLIPVFLLTFFVIVQGRVLAQDGCTIVVVVGSGASESTVTFLDQDCDGVPSQSTDCDNCSGIVFDNCIKIINYYFIWIFI